MRDGLAMAYDVIMHPNSAFATLRDNDRRYFPMSVAVLLLSSIQYASFVSLTPAMTAQEQVMRVAAGFGLTVLGFATTAGIIYLIGRVLGGNKSWRKVFTAIFYTGIIWVPASAFASLLPSLLPVLPSAGLHAMVGAAVFSLGVWVVIVHVKLIKVLNGFGTAKAFGILVLSGIAHVVWIIPVILLYLWVSPPFELPLMQTLPQ